MPFLQRPCHYLEIRVGYIIHNKLSAECLTADHDRDAIWQRMQPPQHSTAEAVPGLHAVTQALNIDLVPSRHCCSSQGGHCPPEADRSSLSGSEPQSTHLIWPLQTATSFIISREKKSSNIEEVTLAVDRRFAAQHKDFSWLD
jgi:hypothetical protein